MASVGVAGKHRWLVSILATGASGGGSYPLPHLSPKPAFTLPVFFSLSFLLFFSTECMSQETVVGVAGEDRWLARLLAGGASGGGSGGGDVHGL